MYNLVTVDPGLDCGWSWWTAKGLQDYGTIHSGLHKSASWQARAEAVTENLSEYLLEIRKSQTSPISFAIETPIIMGQRSQAAGDAVRKLAFLCGMFVGRARMMGYTIEHISPQDWKGSLPKHVTEYRIAQLQIEKPEIFGNSVGHQFKSHEADAVGIALWRFGLINQRKGKKCQTQP